MNNINNIESGERLSFYKLFKEKKYKIVIPIIQRDYAQGRKREKEIRDTFLDALFNYLDDNKPNRDLDFIYGTLNKDDDIINFTPLDGQQRLTTLFLLHWYLYQISDNKVKKTEFKNSLLKNDKSLFSYETRISSSDFCDALMGAFLNINEYVPSDKNEKKSLSKRIKNCPWYYLAWEYDPTIQAMLTMLDAIHEKFSDKKVFLDRLLSIEKPIITFLFLNLEKYNLTDDLYIKMNSRGKPLTPFENFKAKFENFLKFEDKEHEQQIKAKLDNGWLNIFWEIAKKEVKQIDNDKTIEDAPKIADEMFYNFFYNITINFYLENIPKIENINKIYIYSENKYIEKGEKDLKSLVKENIYTINKDNNILIFSKMEDFIDNISVFDIYEVVYEDKDNLNNLITILDSIMRNKITDEFEIFISKKNISYWERARFCALCLGYIHELDNKEFSRWEKVSFNLINNQLIQSPDNLIKTIKSLNELIINSNNNIYGYIKDDSNKIDYFSAIQRDEESLKATLIEKNIDWEKELKTAEDDWYLNGQIGFILEYSKDKNNNYYFDKFIEYRDNFMELWKFVKGNKDIQVLLYQALLTKGYYLPKDGSNYTFCSFNPESVRIKNDNWRKIFNSDKLSNTRHDYKPERTIYLKNLLDDIDLNKDIPTNLKNIIKEWLENRSHCDFKNFQEKYIFTLVSNPKTIKYCKNLKIRYYQQEKVVYLLSKTKMNGSHAELYTYNLFSTHMKGKTFCPFSNSNSEYDYTVSRDQPSIVLCDWEYNTSYQFKLNIYFDTKIEGYKLHFSETNKKDIPTQIVNILKNEKFTKGENYQYILKTDFSIFDESKLVKYIEDLSKKLNPK